MRCFPRILIAVAVAALASGCVSSRYKSAPKSTPPAVVLNLTAAQPPLEAAVQSVIIYRGPGSWKREAYWDEYVVVLANRGTAPFVLESATLTGLDDTPLAVGTDPWVLEKSSRSALAHNFGLAKNALIELGGGLGTVVAGGIVGSLIAPAGWILPAGLGPGLLVGIPVAIGGTVYRNVSNRHEIEAEFRRRKLELPLSLSSEQPVTGSLFFRVTPGPKVLTLAGHTGDEKVALTVDLTRIGALHLKQPAPTPPAPTPPAVASTTGAAPKTD